MSSSGLVSLCGGVEDGRGVMGVWGLGGMEAFGIGFVSEGTSV